MEALDEAIQQLQAEEPRLAEIVMLRSFTGLSVEETAAVVGLSVSTVTREWRFTRAWLAGGPALPSRIGHYRILRLLGEGGMGAVYEAEQDNPRRVVALKVIRPGLVSPALLKRFAHEVQFLGRLHHPGIAQISEAGLVQDGRPFFALEFIAGLPLNDYVHRHQLDPAARLALVARVCDAVQHAHDQGVIHRDLKPGNIPVDETGQPKVLEFGVARLIVALAQQLQRQRPAPAASLRSRRPNPNLSH